MKVFRSAVVAVTVAMLFAGGATAQSYPEGPVRFVVPHNPGGSTDTLARIIADALAERWGQPTVVENRAGADTIVGMDYVARAEPDGYTLGFAVIAMTIAAADGDLPLNPLEDLEYVVLATSNPALLVVNPDVPATTVQELVELARQSPGDLVYSSSGNNSPNNMQMLQFMAMTDTDFLHVPYSGGGPAVAAAVSGEVDMFWSAVSTAVPFVESGQLRALGVGSLDRTTAYPDLPTVSEQGLEGFDISNWTGIVAPGGTPEDIIEQVNGDVNAVLMEPEMQQRLEELGFVIIASTPEEFASRAAREIDQWRQLKERFGDEDS